MRTYGTGCMTRVEFDNLEEGIEYFFKEFNTPSPMQGNNAQIARYRVEQQFGRETVTKAIDTRIQQMETDIRKKLQNR